MKVITEKLHDSSVSSNQGFRRTHIFSPDNLKQSPISLEYVVLPTGAESIPHAHLETHTVVFTIQGGVRIYFGEDLEHQLTVAPKESVYIPPGLIHHVVNENEEDMIAVVARTNSAKGVKEFPHLINSPNLKSINYETSF